MITFLGDVALLNDNVVSKYVPQTDYVFNFEYTVYNKEFIPTLGKINLCSSNIDFGSVFGKKPVAVCVANNHMLDYGEKGYDETRNAISASGIQTIGDRVYWYDDKTCILAYSQYCGALDGVDFFSFSKGRALNEINDAREKGANSIIVNMHWGIENYALNTKEQKELGHWLIDNGVDVVIGHHPHCIQPIEKYKGHFIFYSLGNCIFPSFNVDSHYNTAGISTRKYRFNWRSWNNVGLAIIFDNETNNLKSIDVLKFNHNKLYLKKENVSVKEFVNMGKMNTSLAKLQFAFRKYWLFFISNFCVDGKLFDINALKFELRK